MDRFDLARWNAIRLILLGVLYILYKLYSGGADSHSAKRLMDEISNQVELMDRLVDRGEDGGNDVQPNGPD